jgi:dTDP-4-dehydrorhamnose reductase
VNVLITGTDGQVGRALVNSAPAGATLRCATHRELDIADAAAVDHYISAHVPDVIINAAAYTAVDRAESQAERAAAVNASGPLHLATAAAKVGARLIHISTDFVFDGASAVPYLPGSPTHPLNVYGSTKRDGERHVLQQLPERSVVVRTAWVYAAWGNNFLRTMLKAMASGKRLRVVTDQVGTPTSAVSLARALWRFAERTPLTGIYHWTDAGVASWYDFAVAIAEEAQAIGVLSEPAVIEPIASADYPTAARRPAFSVLDKATAIAAIGSPPQHWRQELRSILREVRLG